jgi:hypothetical protein
MSREDFTTDPFDPDLLVSWNLRKARELRGWTQAKATERLHAFGLSWSTASISDAERAWTPDGRQREFTASDLVAFSLAYDLPLSFWFLPPPPSERNGITVGLAGFGETLDDATLIELSLSSSPEIEDRLSSLGIARSLTAKDRRQFLVLLDTQETQLTEWLGAVRDTRAAVERQPEHGAAEGPVT